MSTYLHIRRWVDKQLSGPQSQVRAPHAFILPLTVMLLPAIIILPKDALVPVAIVIGAIWTLFLVWRAFRLGKADALKQDRANSKVELN